MAGMPEMQEQFPAGAWKPTIPKNEMLQEQFSGGCLYGPASSKRRKTPLVGNPDPQPAQQSPYEVEFRSVLDRAGEPGPMKILVGYKRVVDFNVRIQVKPDGSGVATDGAKLSANPFDDIALEEALRLREKGVATEVVVVTIGPAD